MCKFIVSYIKLNNRISGILFHPWKVYIVNVKEQVLFIWTELVGHSTVIIW